MFYIMLAGVIIGIEARYAYTPWVCEDFIIPDEKVEKPDFTVGVTDERILNEYPQDKFPWSPEPISWPGGWIGYYESQCLFEDICLKMPYYDAFVMHAAVVEVDDMAYAFTAPSGTGKTTHMQLWLNHFGDRAKVVNGDKPLIRVINGVAYACSTPWRGKENFGGYNDIVPLGGVCVIQQSPENHIRRLSIEEASRYVFRQVLISRDSEESFNRFWKLLERMMTTVDFYLLECNRQPEASRLSYLTMRKKKDQLLPERNGQNGIQHN